MRSFVRPTIAVLSPIVLICGLGLLHHPSALAQTNTASQNLAAQASVQVDSTFNAQYKAENVIDGQITNESRWLSNAGKGPHTLTLNWKQPQTIGAIQIASGWLTNGLWQDSLRDFSIQYRDGANWKQLPEGAIVANAKPALNLRLAKPVTTDGLRIVIQDTETVRVAEVRVYAPAPTYTEISLPAATPPKNVLTVIPPLFVNQSGYDLDGTKRFTAPTLPDGTAFAVKSTAPGAAPLFQGTIRGGLGDFTALRPTNTAQDLVVEAANLRSDPFRIAPLWMERVSLAPALHFMVDDRSVVGTHPSAYGGMPWRDGTYYSYEVPSLVMLYMAAPAYFDTAPVEIDYAKDKARVQATDFKIVPAPSDQGVLDAVRYYYTELDAPVGAKVPDIIQLIHWGIGWHMMKPVSADPSGDPAGGRIHAQTVEQFAFFLAGYPTYKRYFSDAFYKRAHDFAFDQWEKVGLLSPITSYTTFKGRDAPGHSIWPNLLMYQIATQEKRPEAPRYLNAAIAQAKWIVDTIDPTDPLATKGQRMSEHMTITGLTALLRDYPNQAPTGLKAWLEKWSDAIITRSDNEWDFRRYDDKLWSMPRYAPGSSGGEGWNEPGNLAGFPACALSIADVLNEPTKGARLRQIATAQWDSLFGRNPVGAHSAYNGPEDWYGVERGWPVKFGDNNCARLELVRGTLNSSAASEHFPYNPHGAFRHPEGWTAFNSAFNVALAFDLRDATHLSLWSSDFRAPLGTQRLSQIGIELVAPIAPAPEIGQSVPVDVTLPDGTTKQVTLQRVDADGTRFRGNLSVPQTGAVTISYGYGPFQQVQKLPG